MAPSPTTLLRRAESMAREYGGEHGTRKRELLTLLDRATFRSAGQVLRLHELLCFLRAYPDDAELLGQVEAMLETFDRRRDLQRHRRELADSGIAGTPIHYGFYAPTAEWLVQRWGDRLTVDWPEFDNRKRLENLLPLLALDCETPGLDEIVKPPRERMGDCIRANFLRARRITPPAGRVVRAGRGRHPVRHGAGSHRRRPGR